jgi:hypothetical protein
LICRNDQLRIYQQLIGKEMKTTKIFIIAAALAVTAIASSAFVNFKKATVNKNYSNKGFAVVELFTSEGCSSCPPADEAVARLQKEIGDKPVYILAFHVDYWNSQGWKDVFSSAEYSKRQRQYAQYLKLSSVYTPQIVVNGKKEFVGSEESTLHNAVNAALQKNAPADLTLSDIKTDQNQVKIHYQTEGTVSNTTLLLALVQKQAQSHVKGGENGGRTLSHVQIVRKLQSVALNNSKGGTENIAVPNGFNVQGWEIIGFLQNISTGEIIGATRAEFPSAMNESGTTAKNTK